MEQNIEATQRKKKEREKKMNNDTDINVYSTYISARKECCVALSKT